MQVELKPVGPAGRRARLSGALAVLGPVLALGLVVAAAGIPRLLALADASPVPQPPLAGIETDEVPRDGMDQSPSPPVLPHYAWDLPVRSIPEVLAERRAGAIKGGLVAIVGILSQDPSSERCGEPDSGLPAVFCSRTALLEAVEARGVERESTRVPHLHPRILPGTPMPRLFAAVPSVPGTTATQVSAPAVLSIVIGRYVAAQTATCSGETGRCRDEFVLERLAWAEGEWIDRILVRDPGLPAALIPSANERTRAIASREADRMERILSMAVLQPGWLAEVDSEAARAAAGVAAGLEATDGPVWYIRSMGRPVVGQDTRLTWAVIHHETGLVLATGVVGPG